MGLQLSNIGVNTTGFVSGKELEQVSAEIFQAAKAQAKASESVDLSKVDVAKLRQADNGISLSGINANTQVSKQIAKSTLQIFNYLNQQLPVYKHYKQVQLSET
jgi:hypothetical protein